MKIIITGGAGFIASHITDAYIKAGHKVVIIDNLSTGFKKNINPKAKFYKADIRNVRLVDKIFKSERPEIVNHHAAITSVTESMKKPVETFDVNLLGTSVVLDAFRKYGMGNRKKFILASTGGAIYGNPRKLPVSESTDPNPLSPYAMSKLTDELIVKFYSTQFDVSYLIFRYANVYGTRQSGSGEAGVVPIFANLMKKNARPTIFGNGKKTRDYVCVEDVAKANLLGLRLGINQTLNISSGTETSDQKIYDTIAEILNFYKKPKYTLARKGEVSRIALDSNKARKILNWAPKTKLAEGIRKAVIAI